MLNSISRLKHGSRQTGGTHIDGALHLCHGVNGLHVYDVVDIVDPTDGTNTSTDGSVTDYCTQEALDDGFIYNADTEWCESESYTKEGYISNGSEKGKIETTEIGVKLRLIF